MQKGALDGKGCRPLSYMLIQMLANVDLWLLLVKIFNPITFYPVNFFKTAKIANIILDQVLVFMAIYG